MFDPTSTDTGASGSPRCRSTISVSRRASSASKGPAKMRWGTPTVCPNARALSFQSALLYCFTMTARILLSFVLGVTAWAATPTFRTDAYLRHVKYLASDELAGRGNGTPELDRAAEYIAGQFRASGLEPAGDGGSFFQKLEVTTGSKLGHGNKLTLEVGHDPYEAVLGWDFVPVSFGDSMRISGEIVFSGYGISAEEYGYDDYKGLDVADKIVLVLGHEPRETDPKSPFDGVELTLHGHDNTRAIIEHHDGARAILIFQDPATHP